MPRYLTNQAASSDQNYQLPKAPGNESLGDKNAALPIASKQINEVIQFQEPTTSRNYSFKTEIRINILEEPKISQKSIDTDDSITLSLFNQSKELTQREESFVTMDCCVKEKTTNTMEPTVFSRNERTQRNILVNSEAPPPYNSHPPPAYTPAPHLVNQPYNPQMTSSAPGGGYNNDPYGHDFPSFLEIQIRHYFVRKVFFILGVQLLITAGFILLTMFHKPARKFVTTNLAMFWIMAALQMIIYIVLICYEAVRRIFPLNFILLFLFTISMSYVCATVTALYSTKIILITAGGTGLICLVVSLLACQTWFDITKWAFIIAIASVIFMIFGFVVMIVVLLTHSPILWLVYSGIATVMFCVYLLYDMQCILGGRRHELSPEEYIFAALTLYVDIVLIFLYMLQLVNACTS